MKCLELRPSDTGSTEITDVISGETGFIYKGPDPAPPEPWTTLLPDHTAVGDSSSYPRASDLSAPAPRQTEISAP